MATQNLRPGYPIQTWDLSVLKFEELSEVLWENHGCLCSLFYSELFAYLSPLKAGHYTGYVRFPTKYNKVLEEYDTTELYNVLQLHGGITYHQRDNISGHVLGFDCAHYGDERRPETRTLKYLALECDRLAFGGKLFMDTYLAGDKEISTDALKYIGSKITNYSKET